MPRVIAPPNRAWLFSHPGVDAGQPGLSTTYAGRIAMADETESIRQSILLLLSTVPGERVMRADYGCDLFRLLFAPNDDTTAGLAIHYVRQAIRRWEPRVNLERVNAIRAEADPSRLDIQVEYRIRRTGHHDLMVYTVSLNGEGA
jgi:Bacteriophage baseplate protein W